MDVEPIRILIVEDHPVFREGLSTIIGSQPDLLLVAQAVNAVEALSEFRRTVPDITLMDVRLPGSDGIDALIGIRGEFPRARIILAQGPARRFQPFDRFAQYRESEGKSLAGLLDEFASLRRENLDVLRRWQLSDLELALEGEHPELGTVTLRQLLATWVAHDLGHVAQTARVLAKQYREAVGPWRAYLPVLDR